MPGGDLSFLYGTWVIGMMIIHWIGWSLIALGATVFGITTLGSRYRKRGYWWMVTGAVFLMFYYLFSTFLSAIEFIVGEEVNFGPDEAIGTIIAIVVQ